MYNIEELNVRLLSELKEIAEDLGVKNYKKLPKKELIYKILDQQAILPDHDLPKKAAKESPAESIEKEDKTENVDKPKAEERRRQRVKRENVAFGEDTSPELPLKKETSQPKKSEDFLESFKKEV